MAETVSGEPGLRFQLIGALGLAWDSLRAHKLRTFLTLLGIMIGVSSVILVGSAIDGLGLYAQESTAKTFGGDSFIFSQVVNANSRKEYFEKLKYNRELKLADEHYLEGVDGDTTLYSAYRTSQVDTKRNDLTSEGTLILGCQADLPLIRNIVIVDGRFFTKREEQ